MSLDIAAFDAADEAALTIKSPVTGELTSWVWTFYGPGHPVTVALADRVSREAFRELAAQKQARVNGKKWKEEEQSLDAVRGENVSNIVARTKSFTPFKINGAEILWSADEATKLLQDRRKGWLYSQISDFLKEEENFIQPSAEG